MRYIDLDSIVADNIYVEPRATSQVEVTLSGVDVSEILDTIGEDEVREYFNIGE